MPLPGKIQYLHALCLDLRHIIFSNRNHKLVSSYRPFFPVEGICKAQLFQRQPGRKLWKPGTCHFFNFLFFTNFIDISDNRSQFIHFAVFLFLLWKWIDPAASHTNDPDLVFLFSFVLCFSCIFCGAVIGLEKLKKLILTNTYIGTSSLCDSGCIWSFQHFPAVCHVLHFHTDTETGVGADLVRDHTCRLLGSEKQMDSQGTAYRCKRI